MITETKMEIIIVEPVVSRNNLSDSDHIRKIKSFFSNDYLLARNLEKSVMTKCGIMYTNKNLQKNLFIVHLEKVSKFDLGQILKIDSFGNWKVKCRLPIS